MLSISNTQLSLTACTSTGSGSSSGSGFFSFPTWYEYLCSSSNGNPQITNINDIWLIVLAIIDILLRVAAMIAVFYIIYGGIKFMTSQGNPEEINKAKSTILSAVIGLIICVIADVTISFIAGQIK